MIKITLKRATCVGCGNCVDIAPDYWTMNEQDGLATLIDSEQKNEIYILITGEYAKKENLEAARICPLNIINVEKF